jgi:hypothetical protein
MNIHLVAQKLTVTMQRQQQYEKRFYFLESRVKMVSEVIMRRLKVLEQEKERMLRSKQLVVKKNPLLDQRDDIHSRQNEKLVNRTPMNM